MLSIGSRYLHPKCVSYSVIPVSSSPIIRILFNSVIEFCPDDTKKSSVKKLKLSVGNDVIFGGKSVIPEKLVVLNDAGIVI